MAERDCDCCTGVIAETPRTIANPPGLRAVGYRVGRHGTFKASMLARLSGADLAALARLRTRSDTDFTIALCDATALVLDVLAFYQERLANETFVRTARERRSVLELARLIGYRLAPGVAAGVHLAFTLTEAPGRPAEAALPVDIPVGTRVQSEPGPEEKPQTFETVEAIRARPQWNAIALQSSVRPQTWTGRCALWFNGTTLGLRPGDVVLFVCSTPRVKSEATRVLDRVEVDTRRGLTRVSWAFPLTDDDGLVEGTGVRAYVFRQRAALFGHNAPDPNLLSDLGTKLNGLVEVASDGTREWVSQEPGLQELHLDGVHAGVLTGSWIAIADAGGPEGTITGATHLGQVMKAVQTARRDYGLSAKVTHLWIKWKAEPSAISLPTTVVLLQSEELSIAEEPIELPLYGNSAGLARVEPDLVAGKALAVTGKRARVRSTMRRAASDFEPSDAAAQVLAHGRSLPLAGAPERLDAEGAHPVSPAELAQLLGDGAVRLRWTLIGPDGAPCTVTCAADRLLPAPALDGDEDVCEIVRIGEHAGAVASDGERTVLAFDRALGHCYDRTRTTINANVARATHGETVSEILGGGDAAGANQRFVLKHAPVTHVSAPTETGCASTLELRVNDLRWEERSTLYGAGGGERVFATSIDDAGVSSVRFGDGIEGSRLPSGVMNLRATYRKGLGVAGNVRSRAIRTLLSRPLGVAGVLNPEAARGGEDPESLGDARRNAPASVLTLGRAVSVGDYAAFARVFPGIAKAHAVWLPGRAARGIFLTVAGVGGIELDPADDPCRALAGTLRRYGDRLLPLVLRSYRPVTFRLGAGIKPAAGAEPQRVLADVAAALRAAFCYEARELGQPVTRAEVVAAMHGVATVEAVDLQRLYRADPGAAATLESVLTCAVPRASDDPPPAAELLTLVLDPLDLEVMT